MDHSKHFSKRELQCPCCKRVRVRPELLRLLEKIRSIVGAPVIINSAYRCKRHNREVGGVTSSWHTQGMAADIRQTRFDNGTFWAIVKREWKKGLLTEMGGLGRYNGRIHVDIHHAADGHLREWDYR